MPNRSLGQVAFEAFASTSALQMPVTPTMMWNRMPAGLRASWERVGEAVRSELAGEPSKLPGGTEVPWVGDEEAPASTVRAIPVSLSHCAPVADESSPESERGV